MILSVIIACEVGFWIAVLGGLTTRYLLGAGRLGAAFLVCAPLVDVVLLVAVAAHLASGATASWHHGLAALYIGFSVTYGHRMISWSDAWFAHRFAGQPAAVKLTGAEYTRRCWGDLVRTSVPPSLPQAFSRRSPGGSVTRRVPPHSLGGTVHSESSLRLSSAGPLATLSGPASPPDPDVVPY